MTNHRKPGRPKFSEKVPEQKVILHFDEPTTWQHTEIGRISFTQDPGHIVEIEKGDPSPFETAQRKMAEIRRAANIQYIILVDITNWDTEVDHRDSDQGGL